MIDSCEILGSNYELGRIKILPTLENKTRWLLSLVLIKTRNAPIPIMKIRQIEPGFELSSV